ncbi:MAG: 50S ribosomal protein L24 [Candidatus Pacebacteria bacterium]|nr:50S ribosomal protein L24 [Candidatus Paceibacterota bacterium]
MKIKKGDKVKMLAGKDKGKTGKVLQVVREEKKASVEGLNLLIKHLRPRREGEQGQRIEFPALVNISNLGLICPKCNKVTRVSYKLVKSESGEKKYRQCKKCEETFV